MAFRGLRPVRCDGRDRNQRCDDISARRRYYRGGGGGCSRGGFCRHRRTGLAIAATQNRRDYYDSYGYYDAGPGYYGGGPVYYGR